VLGIGETIMLGENVQLVFESAYFDPSATVMSGSGQPAAMPAQPVYQPPLAYQQPQPAYQQPQPAYQQPPAYPPQPGYSQQAYVNQVPEGPEEVLVAPKKKGANTWLLAGCGCLVLVLIGMVIAAFVIDYFQLWCTLFGFILGC